MEEVPVDARNVITQEMLDEYNQKLPEREIIEEYKSDMRFYRQAQEGAFDIDLKFVNDGNRKANDIYGEIYFPEELVIYKKNKEKNIVVPKRPDKGVNPIENLYKNKMEIGNARVAGSIHFANDMLDMDYVNQANSPTKHYYNDDNSISIRMDDLMTGYSWSIKDKYVLVPKQKGTFEIICSFMCEEYEEALEKRIQVVVA